MTQSGEVVSHQAHNLGTGGANPSSATKHGVKYMYAVKIITTPNNNEPISLVYNEGYELCRQHWDQVANWFSECIDQNLIINTCTLSYSDEPKWPDITTFYSVNAEFAQQFVDKWMDLDAEFSMQKFWQILNLTPTSQIEPVDFEEVTSRPELSLVTVCIVNDDKTVLWDHWIKSD